MSSNEVEYSEEIDKKIKTIYINYCNLLLKCARDPDVRDDFLNRPRKYLTEEVGMTIPPEVHVQLDRDRLRWPIVIAKTAKGRILIREKGLAMKVIEKWSSGERDTEVTKVVKPGEIDLYLDKPASMLVQKALDKGKVVVVMPYFDIGKEVLGKIEISDECEIVLSSP